MKALIFAALVATTAPFAALADSITLNTPMSGDTLHTDFVDMSFYWVEKNDAFEVVAYYKTQGQTGDASKQEMALNEGDSVTFGLPDQTGLHGTSYTFIRLANAVTVSSVAADFQQALKQ